jgi:protein O-GlcNAc transferase
LAINPESVDALTNLGQLELDADPPKLQDATRHLQHAIAVNPKAATAHSNLGLVWLRLDRLEEALAEEQTALGIRPDFGEVHCHLTVTLESLHRTEDAAAEGRACHDRAPDTAHQIAAFHEARAVRLVETGQIPIALGEYRQALRVSPNAPDLLNAYGALLLSQGNQREAAVVLSEAIRIRPDFAEARANLQRARAALTGDR